MKQLKMLSLILVALIAMGASCNRPPQPQPTQQGLNGEISTQPITVDGEETGYSLSYRSWIVPGTDENGNKAPTPPKSVYNDNSSDGGAVAASKSFDSRSGASDTKSMAYDAKGGGNSSQNDTISVILHDTFYHVDTVGYVSDWNPSKYGQGSYTCHWDRYGLPRPGENNITIMDSTAVLRVQFEEFSFSYRINFEVASYNNGVINLQMPYHSPIVTDLGVEELESLETICRNDSVFARKILKHSIKVDVGNKTYILHAKVLLYRQLPYPTNKYVVRSEVVTPLTETYIPTDSLASTFSKYHYTMVTKLYWSDGTTENYPTDLNHEVGVIKLSGNNHGIASSCSDVYGYEYTNMTTDIHQESPNQNGEIIYFFHYSGTDLCSKFGGTHYVTYVPIYDDGYMAIYRAPYNVSLTYAGTDYSCDGSSADIYARAIMTVDNNPPQVIKTNIWFDILP